MNDKLENEGKLEISFAKEFKINDNNSFSVEDQGKSFLGKSRNYKITVRINDKSHTITRTYGDIRTLYKKTLIEFPYLIFPKLFGKKENVTLDERNENIKYVMDFIAKIEDIVHSEFFVCFLSEKSVKQFLINLG